MESLYPTPRWNGQVSKINWRGRRMWESCWEMGREIKVDSTKLCHFVYRKKQKLIGSWNAFNVIQFNPAFIWDSLENCLELDQSVVARLPGDCDCRFINRSLFEHFSNSFTYFQIITKSVNVLIATEYNCICLNRQEIYRHPHCNRCENSWPDQIYCEI